MTKMSSSCSNIALPKRAHSVVVGPFGGIFVFMKDEIRLLTRRSPENEGSSQNLETLQLSQLRVPVAGDFRNATAAVSDPRSRDVFFVDNYTSIKRLDGSNTISLFAGSEIEGPSPRDGRGTDARFERIVAMTVDYEGNLFVADGGGGRSRIRLVQVSTGEVVTLRGSEPPPGQEWVALSYCDARLVAATRRSLHIVDVRGSRNTSNGLSAETRLLACRWGHESAQERAAEGGGAAARFHWIDAIRGCSDRRLLVLEGHTEGRFATLRVVEANGQISSVKARMSLITRGTCNMLGLSAGELLLCAKKVEEAEDKRAPGVAEDARPPVAPDRAVGGSCTVPFGSGCSDSEDGCSTELLYSARVESGAPSECGAKEEDEGYVLAVVRGLAGFRRVSNDYPGPTRFYSSDSESFSTTSDGDGSDTPPGSVDTGDDIGDDIDFDDILDIDIGDDVGEDRSSSSSSRLDESYPVAPQPPANLSLCTALPDLFALPASEGSSGAASPFVTIRVGGGHKAFVAHRSVLAARSEYFKTLLAEGGGFGDSGAAEVTLEDAHPEAFGHLLAYSYTGMVAVPNELLRPAAELAGRLLLPADCTAQLTARLLAAATLQSVIDDMIWAEQHGMTELVTQLTAYLLQNRQEVAAGPQSLLQVKLTTLAAVNPGLAAEIILQLLAV